MHVIDIEPGLLQRDAEAALHAAEETRIHIEAEFKDDVPNLMTTLVAEGPYAYTKIWELDIKPDGSLKLPITTTRQGIFDGYTELHKGHKVDTWLSLVEVRGEWYTFVEGTGTGLDKASGQRSQSGTPSITLFPVSTGKGITGELVWPYVPRNQLGIGANSNGARTSEATTEEERSRLRAQLVLQHDRYLQALRVGDVEGILKALSVDAQAAIRDYVNDTGTLINLDGGEAHRGFYQSLFEQYAIQSVDLLRRVAQHWYVFAEVRVTATVREGADAGRTLAFNTAEYFVAGHDGRFIARIGHGTDPA